jgi:beta-glucosidase
MGVRGSADATPVYSVSPVEGITKRAGSAITVQYAPADPSSYSPIPTSALTPAGDGTAHGLSAEYFKNPNLEGSPFKTQTDALVNFVWTGQPDEAMPTGSPDNFSARWTGKLTAPKTGHYRLGVMADDGCRLYLDGKKVIDHWVTSKAKMQIFDVDLATREAHDIVLEYFQTKGGAVAKLEWQMPGVDQMTEAVNLAKSSDVTVVVVSTFNDEGEHHDRPSMSLPNGQDALIQSIAAVNKNTIVILNNGTPVDMHAWIDQVPAVLEVWFPGQEGGSAIASILFGDVSPSGKLPTTMGEHREDYPDNGNFPGVKNRTAYEEGIYVGYRHFDKDKIVPLFPFGFGLSYTTFDYGPLRLSNPSLDSQGKVSVSLDVKNTGPRTGEEVVELYIHDPSPKIDKAVRELKGFAKVSLSPGETKTVSLPITPRDLAYFDVAGKQWKADAGDYEIQVGASSRDIRQRTTVHLASTFTEAVPLSCDQLALNGGFGENAAVDLAAGCPVQASSTANGSAPENAVDSDDTTNWTSQSGGPQWLMVDLKKTAEIDRVRLFWGADYALAYSIQISQDGQTWTDVAKTSKGMGDIEWIRFAPTQARWIRLMASQPEKTGGIYSLDDFEVYGPDENPSSSP